MCKKIEKAKYCGNIQQEAFVRQIRYCDGRADGMKAYDVKNGFLRFQAMADKCLDICDFSYKGMNFNFLSKPGLQGQGHYDTNGDEALRSIMGGLFFTCGLENICPPCTLDGKDYPMHGRIRTTPAEELCAAAGWEGEDYVISVSGKMREAELFGENMSMTRTITTKLGEKEVIIRDEIENQSFRDEALMILYHFNMGYPLLSEEAEVILPTKKVIPRDADAEKNAEQWNVMEAPVPNEPERVYIHELAADEEGNTFACLYNHRLAMGFKLSFNRKVLPRFMQWKSIGAGDYVMGLEPSNSSVFGRADKDSALRMLKPFEKEVIELKITVVEGSEELENIKEKVNELKGM